MDRRLIEETFPIKEVSKEALKEKRNRHGTIATFHTWWARRPMGVSRGTVFASLVPLPDTENKIKTKNEFVNELSLFENTLSDSIINKARKEIISANKGQIPKIIDPFAGGGSIPLEALRLGCESHALDYNPVSCFILKSGIELPSKMFQSKNKNGMKSQHTTEFDEVEKWSNWVFKGVKKEILNYFPDEGTSAELLGWVWAKTIDCQNPKCKKNFPLLSQYWLAKSKKRKIVLYPYDTKNEIKFKIIDLEKESLTKNFDPSNGTITKRIAECPSCGFRHKSDAIKTIFKKYGMNEKIICVISQKHNSIGKIYRIATNRDKDIFEKARKKLYKDIEQIEKEWKINPIPDEDIPGSSGSGAERAFSVKSYGYKTWGDMFNSRQKLFIITTIQKIRNAHNKMLQEKLSEDKIKFIISSLCVILDRVINFDSVLCHLNTVGGRGVTQTFSRQTLPIVWDYMESNPFNSLAAGWISSVEKSGKWLENISKITNNLITVQNCSATSLPYSDEYFDAVFTDPPYYDNIPYSYLSDFFYVWLKRMAKDVFPELFSTLLTPKTDEIVLYTYDKSYDEAKIQFETMLSKSFQEMYRVLKKEGIAIIVYAHKTTEGWETLVNSILNSGLVVTAAWPLSTEMGQRLTAQESAALASSIYMVCRKWKKEPHESYNNVKKQMQKYLDKKLDFLWSQDIRGSDFFISAIGSAIEVFGKYEKITDNADNEIKVPQLLEDVRKIVSEYAIKKVLRGDIGGKITTMTRFYVLWRSAYGQAKVPYDDARKLATSLGVNLEQEWNKGFIKKDKEFVRVIGPEDRSVDEIKDPTELIDVLHKVLILWRNNKKEEYEKLLTETVYTNNDTFKRVAQAISESLPDEIKEKKWIDGFLTGFTDSGETDGKQTKLKLFE